MSVKRGSMRAGGDHNRLEPVRAAAGRWVRRREQACAVDVHRWRADQVPAAEQDVGTKKANTEKGGAVKPNVRHLVLGLGVRDSADLVLVVPISEVQDLVALVLVVPVSVAAALAAQDSADLDPAVQGLEGRDSALDSVRRADATIAMTTTGTSAAKAVAESVSETTMMTRSK